MLSDWRLNAGMETVLLLILLAYSAAVVGNKLLQPCEKIGHSESV